MAIFKLSDENLFMSMTINLSKEPSILGNYLSELRHSKVQKDRMKFRVNLSRIGELMAYEISKSLDFKVKTIKTPLGTARQNVLSESPVLATIMRAGLEMHNGLLNIFDHSDSSFVSAYRKHSSAEKFDIKVEYIALTFD